MPTPVCQSARAPPSGPCRVRCGDLPPCPPAQRPHPPDLQGRQQPSYLQPEGASAPPTAAASWSRTERRRRGTSHFRSGGHWALAPELGGGTQEIPLGTVCRRLLRASLAGTSAQLALVECLSWSLRSPARPPDPARLGEASQQRGPRSSFGRMSAARRAAGNKAPGGAEAPPRPAPPPPSSRAGKLARLAAPAAQPPTPRARRGTGREEGAALTFFGTRPRQPRPNCG